MRISQRFLSLVIVVMLLNSAAYADSGTAVMIQLPEQFTYTNFSMSEKGYYFAGYDGISPVEIPVGMFYEPSGRQVWQHMNIDYPGNIYRSMVELDNGSLAAIRSVDYDGNFDIELFDGTHNETIDINGLYPKDVFMMSDGDKVHFAVLGRKTERNTDWQNVTGMPYFALIDTVEAQPDA